MAMLRQSGATARRCRWPRKILTRSGVSRRWAAGAQHRPQPRLRFGSGTRSTAIPDLRSTTAGRPAMWAFQKCDTLRNTRLDRPLSSPSRNAPSRQRLCQRAHPQSAPRALRHSPICLKRQNYATLRSANQTNSHTAYGSVQ